VWGCGTHNGGSARGYQAIFVPSATLGSLGHDGQPAVCLYIAALEVNVLGCRRPGDELRAAHGWRAALKMDDLGIGGGQFFAFAPAHANSDVILSYPPSMPISSVISPFSILSTVMPGELHLLLPGRRRRADRDVIEGLPWRVPPSVHWPTT
jgi:hypothetical protein